MSKLHPQSAAVPLRVVAIGGGTGLSTLLRGLRSHVSVPGLAPPANGLPAYIAELSAIVTVTDDGGSSGRLRKDFNMLPPGDLRNCMVALSEDEKLLTRLFSHRFRRGLGLKGHSLGNLFVAALVELTGDFAQAIQMASQVLATRGRILPATLSDARLAARMEDGSIVRGETKITASRSRIKELFLEPANCPPLPETIEAIAAADLITMGPGSLYTSLITNLLVNGMAEGLRNAHGVRVYICNLMTQANESLDLTASEHIERIFDHAHGRIFDYALINTAPIPADVLRRYARQGAVPIEADVERVERLGVRCVTGDFAGSDTVVRHIGERVTGTLMELGASVRIQQ